MEDERGEHDLVRNGDDTSVRAGETSDIELVAGAENSAMVTMFPAIMMKMDQQAVQIQTLAAGFAQIKTEACQFTLEQCDSLKGELMIKLRHVRLETQAAEQSVIACKEELAEFQTTVQKQTSNREGQQATRGRHGVPLKVEA